MANIQLYTQPIENYYSDEQIAELNKSLDPRLIKTRQEGNQTLKYIQGHTAIDRANAIFGHGNWGSRVLECTLQNVIDPISGEGLGAIYLARVEVWVYVRGAKETVVDVGSQPVSVASVEEQVMGRRINDAKYNHKPVDESPFTPLEKKNARAVIIKAHEQAQKGAATDGLKRALRLFGDQFGNSLYGDGHIDVSEDAPSTERTVDSSQSSKSQKPQPRPLPVAVPKIADLYQSGGQVKLWSNKTEFMCALSQILGLESVPGDFNPTVEQRQKIAAHIETEKQALLSEVDQTTNTKAS